MAGMFCLKNVVLIRIYESSLRLTNVLAEPEITESGESVAIKNEDVLEVSFETPFLVEVSDEDDKPVIEICVNEEPVEEREWTITPLKETGATKFATMLSQPIEKGMESCSVHLTHKNHEHLHFVVVRSGEDLEANYALKIFVLLNVVVLALLGGRCQLLKN